MNRNGDSTVEVKVHDSHSAVWLLRLGVSSVKLADHDTPMWLVCKTKPATVMILWVLSYTFPNKITAAAQGHYSSRAALCYLSVYAELPKPIVQGVSICFFFSNLVCMERQPALQTPGLSFPLCMAFCSCTTILLTLKF